MVTAPANAGFDVADIRVGMPTIFETFRSNNGTWTLGPTSISDRTIADGMLIINQADANTLTSQTVSLPYENPLYWP